MSNQKPFRAAQYRPNAISNPSQPQTPMIGQILSGIAGVGQSLIQRGTDKRNIAAQNKYNKELAKYTYDLDLEQWNRANKFNSPLANMARLKEAGLNPNLVYGTGSATQLAGESPKYQQSAADQSLTAPNIEGGIQSAQAYRQGEANIALTHEQTQNVTATKDKTISETDIGKSSEGRKVDLHTLALKAQSLSIQQAQTMLSTSKAKLTNQLTANEMQLVEQEVQKALKEPRMKALDNIKGAAALYNLFTTDPTAGSTLDQIKNWFNKNIFNDTQSTPNPSPRKGFWEKR